MTDSESVQTSVHIPRALLTRLRQKLIGEGETLSGWFRKEAQRYLDEEDA